MTFNDEFKHQKEVVNLTKIGHRKIDALFY